MVTILARRHTRNAWVWSKGQNIFFSESSHVAYQIKGNGSQTTMQAHIMYFHTTSIPRWGQKVKTFFLTESSHVAHHLKGN